MQTIIGEKHTRQSALVPLGFITLLRNVIQGTFGVYTTSVYFMLWNVSTRLKLLYFLRF